MSLHLTKHSHLKYRPDIDGLRALAVVPVILFHAGFQAFSGGFVGVDVFFVISGYLITGIILAELEQGKFSIVNFYERRARRILPALFFVMLCCIPFAWLWLLPQDMKSFSQSLVAVIAFLSNIFFWQTSGYFDTSTELKPMLHTWSLSVEEQYYVFFPLFLIFAWRFGKKFIGAAIVLIAIVSLLAAEYFSKSNPMVAFYLLPMRAWELMIGALVAFYCTEHNINRHKHIHSQLGGLLGFVLICYSIFVYDKQTPFPSFYTLAPTMGAALIIAFNTKHTVIGRLLGSKLFVGVGLISYSAYLWHQPLFSLFRHATSSKIDNNNAIILIAVVFFVSYISWLLVERPFRRSALFSSQKIWSVSLVGLVAFLCLGTFGHFTDGFKNRFPISVYENYEVAKEMSSRSNTIGYKIAKPTWVLLGDSHANSLQESFGNLLNDSRQSAVVMTVDGCPPALNLKRHDMQMGTSCEDNYKRAISMIKSEGITSAFVVSRFALYANSVRFDNEEGGVEIGATTEVIYDHVKQAGIRPVNARYNSVIEEMLAYIKILSDSGVKVFVLTSIPEVGWDVPNEYLKRSIRMDNFSEIKTSYEVYVRRNRPLLGFYESLRVMPNVKLIDSAKAMCDDKYCYAVKSGTPYYSDSNHLNRSGAKFLIDKLSIDF